MSKSPIASRGKNYIAPSMNTNIIKYHQISSNIQKGAGRVAKS